ncbi:MAG: hypothetical protein WKI04_09130 [Ferruginibacter sp.]
MIKNVGDVLSTHPNVLHVSGHEHALQLIQGAVLEVNSGSAAKHSPVKMGKGSLFAMSVNGYITADILSDLSTSLIFRAYRKGSTDSVFSYHRPFVNPFVEPGSGGTGIKGDNVNLK